ncbi:MAG: TIM-barrel domain-containing protein [Bryobacteraceae bacterium]
MAQVPVTRRQALQTVATATGTGFLTRASQAPDSTALHVAGKAVEIVLSSVSPRTVRIEVSPIDVANGQSVPSDGALVQEQWGKPVARLRGGTKGKGVKCGDLMVAVTSNPFTIRVQDKGNRVVQELRVEGDSGNISFTLGDGTLLGLGQGGPQFDRRGKVDRMTSGQGGYQLRTHGAKVPIPFLVGTSGWAMYVHEPAVSFDLTGERGVVKPTNTQARVALDIFVIGTKDPAAIMAEYAKITGHPEMAPLWSFGYQQSHRTLSTPDEILQEAKTFREKELPCDAMIYLGTDFTPLGWNTHNGEFTWNSKVFPDPRQAIDMLHKEHFKVVLHIVIEGHKLTGTVKDPCTAAPLPSGRTPDNHWPPDRQVSCYWPVHKQLLDVGIDGWWPDQGDGLDAPSRLARNRMYFEGQQLYRPNERVYALHRNGYAGMQRFAAFLWSGDIQSTWETLKTHVPVAINTGISGIPYWGTDIGGFVPTQEYTGELFARWFQFAAFNPLFRSHGRDWRLHLPWGWTVGEIGYQETPSYHPDPKNLHNPAIEPICKKYLELRYQFMPYLYSAVKETCETGLPIVRALWLHYPEDQAAVARCDEYLYGRDVLVAPVVEKGATSRSVYLPRGKWFDFWTKEVTEGGREITRNVDLETIPLYVRAGAVLPIGPIKQYTAENVDEPLTIWIHPGADGAFSLYEDDGKTFNYREGEFMRVDMVWNDTRRQLSMRLAKGSKMMAPERRKLVVKVAGQASGHDAVFEGRPLVVKL